jgi:glycosyltransferase involved in cell wall biosynthesis
MRICFLGHFTAGGTERATFIVANGLAADSSNDIYILSSGFDKNTFPLSDNVTFCALQQKSLLKRNIEIYRFITANKIDLLVTIEAMSGILSIMPAILSGCKHIVWEHANYFQRQGSRYIQKIRQIELYLANAYVVLTKRDLTNFKSHFKVRTKLLNIYNVADKQHCDEYNLDSKVIVSAGHVNRIKNFIVIPDIAKIVFAKHPDWRWFIYGSTSSGAYEAVKAKIDEYGLQDKVIFKGQVSDMSAAYKDASMYVMTSLQEGLPMVLLEAKSHKLPLISFDIETGPDEIIRNEINGFLTPAYNVEAMAEKICTLIENPSLRQQFSDASHLDLKKFDKNTIISAWSNLIDSISQSAK